MIRRLMSFILFSTIFGANLLFTNAVAKADQITATDLDFNLLNRLPRESEMIFGSKLFTWEEWLQRKSSRLLNVKKTSESEPDIPIEVEVFEAHAAAIVKKPVSFFTKEYFLNLNTINQLDPNNKHVPYVDPFQPESFNVITTVDLPPIWAGLIAAYRASLDFGSLVMLSKFTYFNKSLLSDPKLRDILAENDITGGRSPDIMLSQKMTHFNQIGSFGRLNTLFYGLDANHTLVVNYFAIGLKKKDMTHGLKDSNLNGRGILLGLGGVAFNDQIDPNIPLEKQKVGIGAGLPLFTKALFNSMLTGF